MSNKNIEKMKEYMRMINKKQVKKTLSKVVVNGEKTLYYGRKWIVVVMIPLLEVMANVLALMDATDDEDDIY